MPNSCAAFGCSNHNLMENKPGFYRFPNNNPERRKMWISACKRKNKDGTADWNPTGKNVYLCGKHFTTGKPVKDPAHPDYIPTIFVYTQNDSEKNKKKIERFESAKKRSLAKARTPVAPKKQRTLNFVSPGKPPLQQSNTFISPPLSPCSSTTSLMSPLPEMPEMEVDFSLSSQTQQGRI
ncbi:THAP domain-containing protein 7-like [Hydractinia symbiolongicarpus]|uniref:THAP domain-containing protein 7-like n=1 Tax=Hydractinia symbiolongicarpus TaxID=13093 RepID=UPI00254F12A3|nr:THAP domain-containing protein 7-like [Hydractinia symbiolongicarpus]